MKVLFLGDIVGALGLKVVQDNVPTLRKKLDLNIVIANAENVDRGRGITPYLAKIIFDSGVDVITLGNHFLANEEIVDFLDTENNITRPANYSYSKGKGITEVIFGNQSFIVVNLLTRLDMHNEKVGNPFKYMQAFLSKYDINSENIAGILVDLHGISPFEKIAFANYVDGNVTAVIGTHTHTPTADYRILRKGTAFQTDCGMCGVYDSCLGVNIDEAINFLSSDTIPPKSPIKWSLEHGTPTLSGIIIDVDSITKLARSIYPLIIKS